MEPGHWGQGAEGGEGAKENAPGEMADHSRLLKF